MLSDNDKNYLKLLYDKFEKTNLHIRNLVLSGDLESADYAIQEKDTLLLHWTAETRHGTCLQMPVHSL